MRWKSPSCSGIGQHSRDELDLGNKLHTRNVAARTGFKVQIEEKILKGAAIGNHLGLRICLTIYMYTFAGNFQIIPAALLKDMFLN